MPERSLFDINAGGILLEKTDLPFENKGVSNPTCLEKDGVIHMFYRAISKEDISTIGYVTFDTDHRLLTRNSQPVLVPEFRYESQGIEDPRIVFLDGLHYLFYTAFDGVNARVAYAVSTDLLTFTKKGLISPSLPYSEALKMFEREKLPEKYFWYGEHYQQVRSKDVLLWDKDFFLFPRKIQGKFALLHRIMPGIQFIAVDRLDELQTEEFWRTYLENIQEYVVMNPELWFESKKIGGGAPPIETPDGWLFIYHAVEEESRTYRAAAALLDINDPRKVIGRLSEPLFSPSEEWEKKGIVANVVFPTSVVERDGRLTIYYGAADDCIGWKTLKTAELLHALKNPTL